MGWIKSDQIISDGLTKIKLCKALEEILYTGTLTIQVEQWMAIKHTVDGLDSEVAGWERNFHHEKSGIVNLYLIIGTIKLFMYLWTTRYSMDCNNDDKDWHWSGEKSHPSKVLYWAIYLHCHEISTYKINSLTSKYEWKKDIVFSYFFTNL